MKGNKNNIIQAKDNKKRELGKSFPMYAELDTTEKLTTNLIEEKDKPMSNKYLKKDIDALLKIEKKDNLTNYIIEKIATNFQSMLQEFKEVFGKNKQEEIETLYNRSIGFVQTNYKDLFIHFDSKKSQTDKTIQQIIETQIGDTSNLTKKNFLGNTLLTYFYKDKEGKKNILENTRKKHKKNNPNHMNVSSDFDTIEDIMMYYFYTYFFIEINKSIQLKKITQGVNKSENKLGQDLIFQLNQNLKKKPGIRNHSEIELIKKVLQHMLVDIPKDEQQLFLDGLLLEKLKKFRIKTTISELRKMFKSKNKIDEIAGLSGVADRIGMAYIFNNKDELKAHLNQFVKIYEKAMVSQIEQDAGSEKTHSTQVVRLSDKGILNVPETAKEWVDDFKIEDYKLKKGEDWLNLTHWKKTIEALKEEIYLYEGYPNNAENYRYLNYMKKIQKVFDSYLNQKEDKKDKEDDEKSLKDFSHVHIFLYHEIIQSLTKLVEPEFKTSNTGTHPFINVTLKADNIQLEASKRLSDSSQLNHSLDKLYHKGIFTTTNLSEARQSKRLEYKLQEVQSEERLIQEYIKKDGEKDKTNWSDFMNKESKKVFEENKDNHIYEYILHHINVKIPESDKKEFFSKFINSIENFEVIEVKEALLSKVQGNIQIRKVSTGGDSVSPVKIRILGCKITLNIDWGDTKQLFKQYSDSFQCSYDRKFAKKRNRKRTDRVDRDKGKVTLIDIKPGRHYDYRAGLINPLDAMNHLPYKAQQKIDEINYFLQFKTDHKKEGLIQTTIDYIDKVLLPEIVDEILRIVETWEYKGGSIMDIQEVRDGGKLRMTKDSNKDAKKRIRTVVLEEILGNNPYKESFISYVADLKKDRKYLRNTQKDFNEGEPTIRNVVKHNKSLSEPVREYFRREINLQKEKEKENKNKNK